MIQGTPVPLEMETKEQLAELKNHPGETYDQLITRIIKIYTEEDNDLLDKQDILDIKESIKDIEAGNYTTQAQMKKKYGIK